MDDGVFKETGDCTKPIRFSFTLYSSSKALPMCYYYYSIPDLTILEQRYHARFDPSIPFSRVYFVSGFSKPRLPVITNKDTQRIQLLNWGLIPHWVKDEATANKFRVRTLNARAETIHEKRSFRHLITTKRCLVLADGFFEWRHYRGRAFPYYIRLKNHSPFAFAGLWDKWISPSTQQTLATYSVITTKANSLLEKVHNKRKRMPVLLRSEDEQQWLASDLVREEIDSLMVSYDASQMQAHPVSRLVTARKIPRNVPDAIRPATYPELPPIVQ
ncbi:MAG: SOS response-associated peptidase [Candidatus Bathyarchaeia archaeon]